jgi:hypothetical protein
VDAVEAEAAAEGSAVAPWYYEQLASIYHKRKDFDSEVPILQRFARQQHAPGSSAAPRVRRPHVARTRSTEALSRAAEGTASYQAR